MSLRALCVLCVGVLAAAAQGAAPARPSANVGGLVIQAGHFEAPLAGPMTWSQGVTANARGLTLTCAQLRATPAKRRPGGAQDTLTFSKLEATGGVRVRGTYTANDGTAWGVDGTAESGTYTAENGGQAVLHGQVNLHATNQTTRTVWNVKAAKAIYDVGTQTLSFEPPAGGQVEVDLQEPPKPATAVPAAPGAGRS